MNLKLVLSVFWTIFIFLGSITSGNTIDKIKWIHIPHFDKMVHFVWYFVLYLLWYSLLIVKYSKWIKLISRIYIALIITIYGFLIELLQMFFAFQRSFELNDILINFSGILTALIFFFPIYQSKIFGRFL